MSKHELLSRLIVLKLRFFIFRLKYAIIFLKIGEIRDQLSKYERFLDADIFKMLYFLRKFVILMKISKKSLFFAANSNKYKLFSRMIIL